MASTRDLRRRIKSIRNTKQITKAMKMVSATKMRRAQNQALSDRPYAQTIVNVLSLAKIDPALYPLLTPNGSDKIGVLLLSTDKGLCGALNTNLFRRILNPEQGGKTLEGAVFFSLGKKGRDFIARTNKSLEADFVNEERVNFHSAVEIRKLLVAMFLEKKIGEVYVLYPHFVTTLHQEPMLTKLLPIESASLPASTDTKQDFLFEPSVNEVLEYCLTHLIDVQIYQAILETKASEHSARMITMQNATENAEDLVSDLTLTYNQLRQGAITKELLENISAGAALE